MGVDIYSYLNSSTYNIVQKILEFRENHPILYTIALAAAIGLIAVIASGPLKVIAAAAFSAGAISMGATAWVIWLKLSVYLVFGETDKIAELADEIPETIRNSFEIGAIAGAIAQALSMIFEWIAEKISTLWGKAKDWFKGTSTPNTPVTEGGSGADDIIQYEKLKSEYASEEVYNADRVGSAVKDDPTHKAASYLSKEQLASGRTYSYRGGDGRIYKLLQTEGQLNGVDGIYEYIIDDMGQVTHQRFIQGGIYTGFPNQKVP